MHPRGGFRRSRACIRLRSKIGIAPLLWAFRSTAKVTREGKYAIASILFNAPPAAVSSPYRVSSYSLAHLSCIYIYPLYPVQECMMGFYGLDLICWARAREIPIFLRGRRSRCDRARFTVFSGIQSTTFFAHSAACISAKSLPGVRHIACMVFFHLPYHEFIMVKDANIKFIECVMKKIAWIMNVILLNYSK